MSFSQADFSVVLKMCYFNQHKLGRTNFTGKHSSQINAAKKKTCLGGAFESVCFTRLNQGLVCRFFLSTLCATEQTEKKKTHLHSKIVFLSGFL